MEYIQRLDTTKVGEGRELTAEELAMIPAELGTVSYARVYGEISPCCGGIGRHKAEFKNARRSGKKRSGSGIRRQGATRVWGKTAARCTASW